MNTQSLYDRVSNEFGVYGNSVPFEEAFFSALLSVKYDMLSRTFVEFDPPTSLFEDIDIDDKHYNCVYRGIVSLMTKMQEWNTIPKGNTELDYTTALRDSQRMYLEDNPPDTYFSAD